jgi:hypothetical protein
VFGGGVPTRACARRLHPRPPLPFASPPVPICAPGEPLAGTLRSTVIEHAGVRVGLMGLAERDW